MDQNIIADWNDITVRGKAMNLEGKPFGFQTPNTFVLEEWKLKECFKTDYFYEFY